MTYKDPLIVVVDAHLPALRRMEFDGLPELLEDLLGRTLKIAKGMFHRYGEDRLRAYQPADLVSELFLDVLTKGVKWIPHCESAEEFIGILFTRLKQLFVSMCRRIALRVNSLTEDLDGVRVDPLVAVYTEKDIRLAWRRARAYRPARERRVGDLLLEGYTTEEIVDHLGYDPTLVSTYVSRVRLSIRKRMGASFAW